MPLTRALASSPRAAPNGVAFALVDRSKVIRCLVTKAALEKLAPRELLAGQFDRWFQTFRDRIEATASAETLAELVMIQSSRSARTEGAAPA